MSTSNRERIEELDTCTKIEITSSTSSEEFVDSYELDGRMTQKLYLQQPDTASLSLTSDLSSGASQCPLPHLDSATGLEDSEYQHLDRYGFIHVQNTIAQYERANEKEASRSMKWMNMLNESLEAESDVSKWPRTHRKFERRLAKGVPDSVRSRVWPRLASRLKLPPYDYKNLYLKISGYERQIDLDIERTLRDHVMFKIRFSQAQVSLFKMLVAYSNFDPVVGYCQGMSTVAAFLLLYFTEEIAFEMLVQVMQREKLRTFYTSGFPLLFETFYVQEKLMDLFIPSLRKRLDSFGITPSVYATKWYLTLYLGFPFRIATRIWDLFLFHGRNLLTVVAVALLKCMEREIMEMEYESCLQLLSRLPENALRLEPLANENRLIKVVTKYWNFLEKDDHSEYMKRMTEEFYTKNKC